MGCVGYVDCSKIIWKNYPTSLKEKYHYSKEDTFGTVQVVAVCDRYPQMWYWFAGRSGKNNHKTMGIISPPSRIFKVRGAVSNYILCID